MEWNDDCMEEDDVLLSEWHGVTRDDSGEDVEQFGSTVELVLLVDQTQEAFVDIFPQHLAAWNYLRENKVKCQVLAICN